MVSQLLSPKQPKNLSDILLLAILGLHILACCLLPSALRIPLFAAVFLFWRASYNVGIGYLLHVQSRHRRLVAWAKKSKIFADPNTGENPHPTLYGILKREMETKIPEDYKFEDAPVEYNTWLLFRRVVDLILMCDFVSYCLFATACSGHPVGESLWVTAARWLSGFGLVGFNLWVKLDAHRVVKDYAWYWGDFFYLIDQELTFDGVFEMAPHPMYSLGYAGYYGISLMAASQPLLFISIIAHAAQFAFLVLVENPHIEKTYNSPPARKQLTEADIDLETFNAMRGEQEFDELASAAQPASVHRLMGFNSIDFYRATDVSMILLQLCFTALTLMTPSSPFYRNLFVINAALWRVWFSVGIGFILNRQSAKKRWTRHFLKFGETTEEAWRQWKGIYHLSVTMSYSSFIAAVWKSYSLPADWGYGLVLLRHVIGAGLVILQIWTAASIYESLGEFGWFYGDFFLDHSPKLTYSGIYRYLNNPERVIGLAGIWGAVFITSSSSIVFLALLSHILTLLFIQFVERPHMQRLYGQSLRRDSGLVKSLKRSLPPPLQKWHGSVDKMVSDTLEFVEEFVNTAKPKIAAGVNIIVKDSTALFKQPTRISITRLAPDLAGYDPRDYSVKVEGTPSTAAHKTSNPSSSVLGHTSQAKLALESKFKSLTFEYGTPIKVRWAAPLNHCKKDWVGLYRVADNASREVTRVISQGRWIATNKDEYDSIIPENGIIISDVREPKPCQHDGEPTEHFTGEMVFSGDKLWWTSGVFEFRYHHNGKHNVMAVSLPFEILIDEFDEDDAEVDAQGLIRGAVEKSILRLVQNCFDRDPDVAPRDILEEFGELVDRNGKYAKRVVFAVRQM